jgi:metallo-beta-lactamase family protein
MAAFRTPDYGKWTTPVEGVRARWWNAGHMLGSASIELEFAGAARPMRVLVSGDVGSDLGPLHAEPEGPSGGLDHLIVESTYGDEDRPAIAPETRRDALAKLVRRAAKRAGALLIPIFAVERAQEVVMDLVTLMRAGQVPQAAINLDSPLAQRATGVFQKHVATLEQHEAMRAALADPLLHHVEDWEESRRLTQEDGFQIVLAGSGMCEAGRIRQHLKARLWDAQTTVALVGFQAAGTLGRLLHDGAKRVRIQGEPISVGARIAMIEGYSGHADGPELGRWIQARGPVAGGVFLVHGEEDALIGLAKRVLGRAIVPEEAIIRPTLDERFVLSPGAVPVRGAEDGRRRGEAAERIGQPDWHNQRAALLLQIEEALEQAGDDRTRAALLDRLRLALDARP